MSGTRCSLVTTQGYRIYFSGALPRTPLGRRVLLLLAFAFHPYRVIIVGKTPIPGVSPFGLTPGCNLLALSWLRSSNHQAFGDFHKVK